MIVIRQREFIIIVSLFIIVLLTSGSGVIESYDESSIMVPLNHSDIYNSMIYPFTRLVIYGVIWYQGKEKYCKHFVLIC
jgi:hypothetical protein